MERGRGRGVQGEPFASDENNVPKVETGPPAVGVAPNSQAKRLRQARDLTVQRRFDEAVALYKEVARDDPLNVKARNNLGVLYDELGHHELALEQFEAARAFYSRLMPAMGLEQVYESEKFTYFVGGRTAVGIQQCDPEYDGERFVQGRVGLHHICLRARSREDVDKVGALLLFRFFVMLTMSIINCVDYVYYLD